VLAGLLASWYQDRVFRAQRVHELTVQAEILAASVTAALVFQDAKAVQEHVSALAINPEIESVDVYGSSGRLVGSFERNRDPSQLVSGDRPVIAVPVMHATERLGRVQIRATADPLERRLARHVPMMLLAIMAALLLAFTASANRLLRNEMEERAKAEEALRQSQKMEAVGRLAGGVAHDFNNLLTIIQGSLHLLRKSDPTSQNGLQLVTAADDAAERAGHLVQSLLAFSRRQPLSPKAVDLNALATGIKDLIAHSVGDRIHIEWELNATWRTLCDVNQMENVILNIAINARDAMPDGGTLTIRTTDCSIDAPHGEAPPGHYVELAIRDTGTGMTKEVRRRAIDPFFTTKPHGRGTGLGLSTAFAFIRQSNGDFEIRSEVGKGTTIVILLPRLAGAVVGTGEAG
jgi:signal transduction histidine kinase